MEKPKFKNIPNDHVTFGFHSPHSGISVRQDYFISRAVAVVGVVFISIVGDNMRVLVTKRSEKMRDEAGKYGVPCGYLDWNETLYDAMVREVYEETSLYLPNYEEFLVTNNNKKSFTVHDKPTDNRQNVSHIFLSVYDFNKNVSNVPTEIESYKDKETAEVMWMSLLEFYQKYDTEYSWAFNHNETIKDALKFYNKGI
jgi:8-oxo-dGTP pyrophosphatase MutT (NUDIX family)